MTKLVKQLSAAITVFSLMMLGLMLAGCGGGSGGVSSEVVSGTAAVGSALSGQVSLKDSSTPVQQRTTVIGSDGTFAIDVTGMKAPYVLQAKGSADGTAYTLHSFSEGTGTANINPLSDVIVASAAGNDDPEDVYEKADPDICRKIKNNLPQTVSTLMAKLQPLLKQYNAEHVNPITSPYSVNHLGLDGMFDNVKIVVEDGAFSITSKKDSLVIFTGKLNDINNGTLNLDALPPTAAVPAPPAGLSATGGTAQMTLAWTSVSNATSYNLYYATTAGVTTTTGTKVTSVSTPYIQTDLASGTTYYYVVTAVNSSGESAVSTQASAATTAAPPQPQAPVAPTGAIATGGTNQVTLSWSPVGTATSYNLYYATTSGVTKANGTKITSATSPAVQTGLAAGTTYYYIVTAVNSAGESAASVQIAASTLPATPAPTAPTAPSSVTAVGSANQATITWPAVAGSTSYNLYWSTTPGVTKINGTKIAAVTSPYVKTALSAGTTYYFIVTAVNSVGESAASPQAAATTSAAPPAVPAAPTGVTANGGANQVTVSWPAVVGATSYNIYWATAAGVTTAGTKITAATSPYVQSGLAAGTTYYYIVTAVNAAGQSVASTQVSAATNAPAVTIPAAPTGVSAVGGANQVRISWAAVAGATTSYNIYYATTSGVTKTSGAKIVNATSPYSQTGLAAGTTYYYIVTAVNSAGEGVASAQASAATNAPPAATCGGCHAIPPALGEHSLHARAGVACADCHGTGFSNTTVNAATHANGVKNVTLSVWNATTRTCARDCHGAQPW